jgi:transcriptional regulator with XRE-family HTH domain
MSPKKYTSPLAQFVFANSGDMPLTTVADGIGISSSYLSEILGGKKEPSIEVCNKIASYFNVSKIEVYKLMGWIDNDPKGDLLEYLIELAKKDPDFVELAKLYSTFYTQEDKKRAIRVLRSLLTLE